MSLAQRNAPSAASALPPPVAGVLREALPAFATNVALALVYAGFAVTHLALARETGRWAELLPVVTQETVLVGLFVVRRRAVVTSQRPLDWLAGGLGTFLPLLLLATPERSGLDPAGRVLQSLGLGLALLSLVALGRSIGVVAADRGLKTGGLYRVVRHPAYAAYLLTYTGFTLTYPSAWNVLVTAASAGLMVARALAEERCLAANPGYCAYRRRVPWRFAPYLF